MVRSEGNMSLKNPVTPPGIDPGAVRLIAQRLNHYATPNLLTKTCCNICTKLHGVTSKNTAVFIVKALSPVILNFCETAAR